MKENNNREEGRAPDRTSPTSSTGSLKQENKTKQNINTFPSDTYDSWTHEQLLMECKKRGLI